LKAKPTEKTKTSKVYLTMKRRMKFEVCW